MGFRLVRLSLYGFLFAALSITAFADAPRERTQFGHNISVEPGEEVTEVACFGCSVRVRGKVQGDVTTFGGNIVIEDQGQVGGDITTFGGDVRVHDGAKVSGVTIFAGRLQRDPGATVGGDVTAFTGSVWLLLIFGLPMMMLGAFIALIVWLVRRLTRPAVPVTA